MSDKLVIPEELRGDWVAWSQHRTARFDIGQWMDVGVQLIERIARAEARIAELEAALKAECEALPDKAVSKDGDCFICKGTTSAHAGNPMHWPMHLLYKGGNGKKRTYHLGCVIDAIAENAELKAALERMLAGVTDDEVCRFLFHGWQGKDVRPRLEEFISARAAAPDRVEDAEQGEQANYRATGLKTRNSGHRAQ